MKTCFATIFLVVLSITGCANINSIHRSLDTTNGQGVLIDIKQRAILAATMIDDPKNPSTMHSVVCAEPSPDALSAYAFNLAAQASPSAANAFSTTLGSAESSAYVGWRTSSIQLLRDQLFRACEAYMNKAITAAEYNLAHRRFQKQTAALLAIEQLTGFSKALPVVVNAAGSAQSSEAPFYQSVFMRNSEKISSLEQKRDATGVTDEQKKPLQNEIDRLNTENKQILDVMKDLAPDKTTTTATGKASDSTSAPTQVDLTKVADTVQHIVDGITQTDDFLQLCVAKFSGDNPDRTLSQLSNSDPKDMREACMRRMGIVNATLMLEIEVARAYLNSIQEDKSLTPEQKREAIRNMPLPNASSSALKTQQERL